jgi:hypothetical protein
MKSIDDIPDSILALVALLALPFWPVFYLLAKRDARRRALRPARGCLALQITPEMDAYFLAREAAEAAMAGGEGAATSSTPRGS